MSKISDKIKKFLEKTLNESLKLNAEFFSKPNVLNVLRDISLVLLNSLISELKTYIQKELKQPNTNISDDYIISQVKNDRNLQRILKQSNNALNLSMVSDIIKKCENQNDNDLQTFVSILNTSDGKEFIAAISKNSDFNDKTDVYDGSLDQLLSLVKGTLPWMMLVCYIVIQTKELLSQNDHPSFVRGKYLQQSLRVVTSVLKQELRSTLSAASKANEGIQEISNKINSMTQVLRSIDSIIVASLLTSSVYLINRKTYQAKSMDSLSKEVSQLVCDANIENAKTDEETTPKIKEFPDGVNCKTTDIDNVAVPHEPFETKTNLKNLVVCDTTEGGPNTQNLETNVKNDTATKAVFENISDKQLKVFVKKNQSVSSKTVLGVLGDDKVYFPINGKVSSVEKNKVTLSDTSDPESSYLQELIKQSQDLYKELNDTKFFLKDFYVSSWFPVMLSVSPLIDTSISATELGAIQYPIGGVTRRFQIAKNSYNSLKDSYENNTSIIAGQDNVKEKAENDALLEIKKELNEEDKRFFDGLKNITAIAENQSKVTMPKFQEFTLIDYYLELQESALASFDQNDTVVSFEKGLNDIIINRYFVDRWNEASITEIVNDMCLDLTRGTFLQQQPDFFVFMLSIYERTKDVTKVSDFVSNLSKNNKDYTEYEKKKVTKKVMFLFDFLLQIKTKNNAGFKPAINSNQSTVFEANFMRSFFGNLWKKYDSIPKQLDEIYSKMDEVSKTVTSYSIKTIDNEEYRYYSFGKDRECPEPKEDSDGYTSPFSQYEFKDIEYWFKYCAIATLVGVTNPATGWATGVPPPVGPISFPVVYIPIKCFQMEWGFIVVGITITGIYPFPWVLFANLSSGYHVPLADPATAIKNSIGTVKKEITTQLKNFKEKTLNVYLGETKQKIDNTENEIASLNEQKRLNEENKPKRDRTIEHSLETYTKQVAAWETKQLSLTEQILSKKTNKFLLETKYKIVYDALIGTKIVASIDPVLSSMQKSEEAIDKQIDKLDGLVSSIDDMLAPLIIAMEPGSASFGFTIKKPLPLTTIASGLDENTNNNAVGDILSGFKLSNSSLMESNVGNKINSSIINFKKYKDVLKASTLLTVTNDPFPKYENLKLTNPKWLLFLYNDWVPTGASCFGIPGF